MKIKRAANSVIQGSLALQFLMTQPGFAQVGVTAQDGNIATLGVTTNTTPCASATATPCTLSQLERALLSSVLAPIPAGSNVIGGVNLAGGTASIALTGGTATVQVQQGNSSTTVSNLHVCGNYTSLSMTVATTLQVVAAVSGKTIYICDFDISNGVTSTTTITWQIGTGTNCANAAAQLGAAWYAGTNWGKIAANPYYRGLNTGAVGSSALCVKSTVTTTFDVGVYYDQY